jgi:hypothetical protein
MSAFRISVYDKNREYVCPIGNPSSLTATIRHNDVSTLTMSLPLGHKRVDALAADGARLKVSFMGEHLISGPITGDAIETNGAKGVYTVTVEDDFRVLKEIAGFPVPGSAITNQSGAEYRTYTGNAETILKTAVTENGVTRLAIPGLTVAANLGRGLTVPGGVPLRMHPLFDRLFPAITDAGLGVTVKQVGANLVVDVYEPQPHTSALSVAGGTLKQLTMTRTRPRASRVIIGGQGEGTARKFLTLTDTARETQYGMRAETFRDARDDNTDAVMYARGQETLDELGPQNGVAITLAGSGIFRYGPGGFHVGDQVPIKVTDTITIPEVIRETTLEWKSKDYALASPVLGELTNLPERKTAQLFRALGKGQRDQERR